MDNILTTTSHATVVEVQLLLFDIIYNVIFQTHNTKLYYVSDDARRIAPTPSLKILTKIQL